MLPTVEASTVLFSARGVCRSYNGTSGSLWTCHDGTRSPCWKTCRLSHRRTRRALSTVGVGAQTLPNELDQATSQTSRSPPEREYLKISDNDLADRWETVEPTPSQLRYADLFFQAQPPKFMWSAAKFRTIDFADAPEVAFLGRSNVGKSSLLNAILGRKICHTSSKPGRTKTMNAISVNGGKLAVLDMPGYGKGSRAEWGKEILKYLSERRA